MLFILGILEQHTTSRSVWETHTWGRSKMTGKAAVSQKVNWRALSRETVLATGRKARHDI